MIMQWKKDGPTAFTARWQKTTYRLTESGGRWRLRADGTLVRGDWASAQIAMRVIDEKQAAIVRGAAVVSLGVMSAVNKAAASLRKEAHHGATA